MQDGVFTAILGEKTEGRKNQEARIKNQDALTG
jgi:hypothetical protein